MKPNAVSLLIFFFTLNLCRRQAIMLFFTIFFLYVFRCLDSFHCNLVCFSFFSRNFVCFFSRLSINSQIKALIESLWSSEIPTIFFSLGIGREEKKITWINKVNYFREQIDWITWLWITWSHVKNFSMKIDHSVNLMTATWIIKEY